MILKSADDKSASIQELEQLAVNAPSIFKAKIEQELRNLRAGIRGEQESAYLIDFDLRHSKNTCVIHDLRLELKGRVAQIDHLLLHRSMNFYVIETKQFHAGIKITETGEFMQWNDFKKTYEGMPSPLAQNERHIAVLQDVFANLIDLPSRLGIVLAPNFHSLVAVASSARVDRHKSFDSSRVVKADLLVKKLDEDLEGNSLFTSVARMVSLETISEIGRQLIRLHRPIQFNYAAKFRAQPSTTTSPPPKQNVEAAPEPSSVPTSSLAHAKLSKCRTCESNNISVQYGKYGYYFKCADCGGNTPIKISCGIDGHKERLRKDGTRFFRECADCQSSSLFFENGS